MDKNLWSRALTLEREFIRRGEVISRGKLQDALQIQQAEAQHIIWALDNKDIIRFKADSFEASGEREIILADMHHPYSDRLSVETVLNYMDEFQPTIITFLGDFLDFYKISRFIKNPENASVGREIEVGRAFLSNIRKRFPKARIIYYQGNHEDRLERYIMESATEIYSLISDLLPLKLDFDGLRIDYKMQPFRIGKLWHLHGHEKPPGGTPEWVCNVMWKYVHDHFVVGHFHREQQKVFKKIDGEAFWTGSVGYLGIDMDYAILNQWTRGFCQVEYDSAGNFQAQNKSIVDGEIYS